MKVLVVGAGFAGAVYARLLAEAGHSIEVIDRRDHVGGNAADFVDGNGIRRHAYGPHIFHSRLRHVIDWISQFGVFVPYVHRVRALLPSDRFVPLPINLDTVNAVFGTRFETEAEVRAHLADIALPYPDPANAAEYLYSQIGQDLTDLFFRPYTKKMWNLDLEELSSAVVRRIPLRMDRTDTYFADEEIQMMPRDGYSALFAQMFDHPGIKVSLNTSFRKDMVAGADFCFNAMAIDEYYDYCHGELPYRSIRFHHRTQPHAADRGWSVTNFTDDQPLTRETAWHEFPAHVVRETGMQTITAEEPCDYRDNNMERYYPVRTADDRYQAVYNRYKQLAASEVKLRFIGRCGTYQYLDMDQVINQSLIGARKWIDETG